MKAAGGGSRRNGHGHPDNPWYVDWIFGSLPVGFGHEDEDTSTLVRRTDQPMVVSEATVAPNA